MHSQLYQARAGVDISRATRRLRNPSSEAVAEVSSVWPSHFPGPSLQLLPLLLPSLASCDVSAIMNREKLMKMASAVRTGGKGSVRRKHKAVHKTTTTDDKRLQNTLKRLGVNTIPGIEEVNVFKEEHVIHFVNPKVQASIAANTWVVSGPSQTKKLEDLLPSIINQLGPDNLVNLKKIAQQYQRQEASRAAEEEDDVPELVEGETFEDAAK
ncbi:basic transcription factor 3 [Physcomitrium patens]|uniref:Nascent polypeptide-associated complex subunit beta n=2 Tax=Physcomitrium patens TaxID=3218 RepID=A0A2K1JDJ4_PHYPA|nr:basic transcription factor 3-like [Physcomitrium patens]PNR39593.1 hypothetical protein PHYPA_019872 [Physcomitrium patens]|eukprot:XP_024397053.1 basic transcription factor 3-like [Physcomitrella patens]